MARLNRSLVAGACHRRCATTVVSTQGWNGLVWVVQIMIRRGAAGLLLSEPAISARGIRLAIAVAIEFRVLRSRNWPILLMTPLIDPHVKDLNRRFLLDAVGFTFQIVVVPAELAV